MIIEKILSRAIILWIFVVGVLLGYIISEQQNNLFKFGPSNTLYILGVCIDSVEKYIVVVIFCCINSGIRTANHNILQSWIINTIQDPKINISVNKNLSYEVTITSAIYNWFDFFMYMNIIMSQIDMLIIEVAADIVTVVIVTSYYLDIKQKNEINTDVILLNL